MTLEKSSNLQLYRAEYFAIQAGELPDRLKSMGYTLEDLQAKTMANEYELVD